MLRLGVLRLDASTLVELEDVSFAGGLVLGMSCVRRRYWDRRLYVHGLLFATHVWHGACRLHLFLCTKH